MPSEMSLDDLVAELRALGEPDRRAVLRRLTVAERGRIERALAGADTPADASVRGDSRLDALIATAAAGDVPSGMTKTGRDALLRVCERELPGAGALPPPSGKGHSLVDVISGALRGRSGR